MFVCRDVSAGYGKRQVLHSISLSIDAGESVALLGPNGCGKTTLLRVLGGTLPPSSGDVYLDRAPLFSLAPKERARRVAVVPQRSDGLPRFRAKELVLLGRYPYLSWFGGTTAEDHAVAQRAMEETGALSLAERWLHELSGGELQRVFLARALAQQTPALLLDELAAGLDIARMVELFDLLDRRRKAGTCLVTVMHDLNLAALYATRLVGPKTGRILFDGPMEQVFTGENLSELYATPIDVFRHPTRGIPYAYFDRGTVMPSPSVR